MSGVCQKKKWKQCHKHWWFPLQEAVFFSSPVQSTETNSQPRKQKNNDFRWFYVSPFFFLRKKKLIQLWACPGQFQEGVDWRKGHVRLGVEVTACFMLCIDCSSCIVFVFQASHVCSFSLYSNWSAVQLSSCPDEPLLWKCWLFFPFSSNKLHRLSLCTLSTFVRCIWDELSGFI